MVPHTGWQNPNMRVLVTSLVHASGQPGGLDASEVGGWWQAAVPEADVVSLATSDGRAGFLAAVAPAASTRLNLTLEAPDGPRIVPIRRSAGPLPTVYLAAADVDPPTALQVTDSRLLGRAIAAAAPGAGRLVIATGGARSCDGGAGLMAELALENTSVAVMVRAARRTLGRLDLIVAVEDDRPLLGLTGASARLRDQDAFAAQENERSLGDWADAVTTALADGSNAAPGGGAGQEGGVASLSPLAVIGQGGKSTPGRLTSLPGAGAGGGLGFALAALGGRLVPALTVVADAQGLPEHVAQSDLVVVVTEVLDAVGMGAGLVPAMGELAAGHGVPVVVLARESHAGRREWSGVGVSGVYEYGTDPRGRVARVARTWAGPSS